MSDNDGVDRSFGDVMDDNKFTRIEEKLDKMSEILIRNTAILDEHQRRSTQLEKRFEPIEEHVKGLKAIVKFFKFVGILVAILEGIRLLYK